MIEIVPVGELTPQDYEASRAQSTKERDLLLAATYIMHLLLENDTAVSCPVWLRAIRTHVRRPQPLTLVRFALDRPGHMGHVVTAQPMYDGIMPGFRRAVVALDGPGTGKGLAVVEAYLLDGGVANVAALPAESQPAGVELPPPAALTS